MSSRDNVRHQIIVKFIRGKISRSQASKLLLVSERTITRLAKKVQNKGVLGVKHGNLGRDYSKKYSEELRNEILKLLTEKYYDFNLKHFHEIITSPEFGYDVSYIALWKWCRKLNYIKNPRKRRSKPKEYRHRMPSEGYLLQMDGCHHRFNGKNEWCLITAIDDATSEIPYGEFFIGETTHGCMKVLKKIIELKGVPKAIYTDRAGWSGGGKRSDFSQFKRACDKIGIQVIFANTPEGKGRIERTFRTIQDRLIPELRLRKIKSMEDANSYLNDEFLKNYWNKEKTVTPESPISEYSPLNPYIDLDNILCVEDIRRISNDQTVSWQSKRYKVKGGLNYGSYDATFKTDFNGKTRVFVRDQEVFLEEIIIDPRAPLDEYFQYNKTIKKDESIEPLPFSLYAEMMPTIRRVRNAVIEHQVYGKPLKIPVIKQKKH